MTNNEAKYLAAFIGHLIEIYKGEGGNDICIPDTPDNQKLVVAAQTFVKPDDLLLGNKQIYTDNVVLLSYLHHVFMNKHSLKVEELPSVED